MSQTLLEPPDVSPPPRPRPEGPPTGAPRTLSSGGLFALVSGGMVLFVALFAGLMVLVLRHGGAQPTTTSTTGAETVSVTLGDFFIRPASVSVPAGKQVTFHVTNSGAVPHNLTLDSGATTGNLGPGQSADLKAGPFDKTFQAFCSIPGHKEAGMVLAVNVAGSTSTAMAGMSGGSSATTGTSAADAKIDFSAMPGPDWHAFDPNLKPADGATVHNVTFHTTEVSREVAPGVTQQMWTFNNQVPGPILHGHVGDVFNVTLVNDSKMGHSIDFHASQVAPNVSMRTIQPGQSLVYQFKADYAGIWMYHCGTAPALQHIGNGMYGAVVIDPPNLPKVDHEYVMVQSEIYLGPPGQSGDYAKMQAATPDAVVFNGYVNQYKDEPIKVNPGERIRVWVLDAGPNESSSFHIVGTIFDTVFKEGHYELQPGNPTQGGSQTLDLEAAQGGFVEFSFAQPGIYTMVTHRFADVGKGAIGTFQAGDVTGTMSH